MLAGGITKPSLKTKREKTPLQLARDQALKRNALSPSVYGLAHGQSGVTVIPFADATKLVQLRAELAAYIDSMPEYNANGLKPNPYQKDEEILEEESPIMLKK